MNVRQVNLSPRQVLQQAQEFLHKQGIKSDIPSTFIKPDGNCMWGSLARTINPSLEGQLLDDAADQLRNAAVAMAMELVENEEADIDEILAYTARLDRGSPLSRDQVVAQLSTFLQDGVYRGQLGDIMPQVMMTYLIYECSHL
jgi:hypothetical protein